jgi:hypothetical protein
MLWIERNNSLEPKVRDCYRKANEMVNLIRPLFAKVRSMGIRRNSYHYFVETLLFLPLMRIVRSTAVVFYSY